MFLILQTLLDLGAAPNYKDGRGLTPLYYSVANDTDAMCSELLLHDRAAIGTPDEQGWYEIHHVSKGNYLLTFSFKIIFLSFRFSSHLMGIEGFKSM